jgi:stress-induced morphogen
MFSRPESRRHGRTDFTLVINTMLCRHCPRATKIAYAIRPTSLSSRASISTAARCATSSYSVQKPANNTRRLAPLNPFRLPSSSSARKYTTSSSAEPSSSEAETSGAVASVEKPDFLNEAESVIWDRLVGEFAPSELVVQDISGGCGSMYGIEICSAKFLGHNMLAQQRMVNAILADLMEGWHGVQIKTRKP